MGNKSRGFSHPEDRGLPGLVKGRWCKEGAWPIRAGGQLIHALLLSGT
jgi:hypothetical protein